MATPAERLQALHRGENPRLVARVPSGWVEMAPFQFRRGYCLLLADPIVPSLNDASEDVQVQFLRDMTRVGDAVRAATGAVRCNYSIYGNLDPFLHAHVVPRYLDEPEDERTLPPLSLPLAVREHPAVAFDPERDGELMERIRGELGKK
jgi:diadenosine tetraphosphate (Ap4A) HIT family hydrolase